MSVGPEIDVYIALRRGKCNFDGVLQGKWGYRDTQLWLQA